VAGLEFGQCYISFRATRTSIQTAYIQRATELMDLLAKVESIHAKGSNFTIQTLWS